MRKKMKVKNLPSKLAFALIISFLALTLYHSSSQLAHFEKEDVKWLAWLLAFGLDAGIGFATFIATNKEYPNSTRIIAGVWAGILILVSYGLNVAHYLAAGAEGWALVLGGIFPVSLAFLGAIQPGLTGKPLVEETKVIAEPVWPSSSFELKPDTNSSEELAKTPEPTRENKLEKPRLLMVVSGDKAAKA